MKVCIVTICNNEIKFLDRWYNSVKEADYICVLDTGSTDGTYEKLQTLPIITKQIKFTNFRFDNARNESLTLVPKDADLCFVVDIDEYLDEGWCNRLKQLADIKNYDTFICLYERFYFDSPEYHAYSTRRRLFVNNKGYKFIYQIHEQLVINNKFDSSRTQWLPYNFKVYHTPARKYIKSNTDKDTKSSFYFNLATQRLNEYKDPLSYFVYYAESEIVTDESIEELERAKQLTSDQYIINRLEALKLRNCLILKKDCLQELMEYYAIERIDFCRDPLFFAIKFAERFLPKEKILIFFTRLKENMPYDYPEYIDMVNSEYNRVMATF